MMEESARNVKKNNKTVNKISSLPIQKMLAEVLFEILK